MGDIEVQEISLLLARAEINQDIVSLTTLKNNKIKLFEKKDIEKVYKIIKYGKDFNRIVINGYKIKIIFTDKNNNRILLEM